MPVSIGIPLASSLIQAGIGLAQSKKRKAAERDVEQFAATDKVNQSIKDFYNAAYNRYAPNAYQSAEYNQAERKRLAGEASALNAAQNRRGALASIPGITRASQMTAGENIARAEAAQRANLSQLGTATGMLSREQNRVYENKFNLLAQKAAQRAKTQNMLLQGALNNFGDAATLGAKYYKQYQDQDQDKTG